MFDLGLSVEEERIYLAALKDSHRTRIELSIANHNEVVVESLTTPTSYVLDGSVQVDTTADVTRSLSLTLLDPEGKLEFSPETPAQATLYAGRFASVHYGVWVDEFGAWVDAPVFFGPLTHFEKQGATISLEGQGKETLLLDPHFAVQGYTLHKTQRLDDGVREVLRRAGEAKISIPQLATRLGHDRVVRDTSEPWKVVKGGEVDANGKTIAGLIDRGDAERRIFYNARGHAIVTRAHRNSVLVIGDDLLTDPVQISVDMQDFLNFVRVTGSKPKGAKRLVRAHAALPPHHALSPASLSRNGVPGRRADFIDASLNTKAQCRDRAEKVLARRSKAVLSVSGSCLPVPTLEEHDVVTVKQGGLSIEAELRQFTIPLTGSTPMSFGQNRRVPRRHQLGATRHPGQRHPSGDRAGTRRVGRHAGQGA